MAHEPAQAQSTVDTEQRRWWWLTEAPALGRYGPRRLVTRCGKLRRARQGLVPTFTGACMVARRWHDGGGALARYGDSASTTRTRRRRVRGVGIFIGGRATFYTAEARWGRSGAFNGRR
jgi:hypothetical protein